MYGVFLGLWELLNKSSKMQAFSYIGSEDAKAEGEKEDVSWNKKDPIPYLTK